MHREMRADLVDHHQLRLVVVEQFDQLCRCSHVTVAHAGLVELHELVDVLFLGLGHQVLQVAAGALAIDVDRVQAGLFRVLPDRRQRAVDPHVVGTSAAIAQGDVSIDAAIGDRSGVAVVEDINAGMRLLQVAVHTERRVDVQVVAGNALVDDQHDIVVNRLLDARQAHRLARADGVVQGLVGEQVEVGQRRIHLR
ncbi:hypothetical protein D3C87_1272230 [compost metagenome]